MFRTCCVCCVLFLTPLAASAQAKKAPAKNGDKVQPATAQDYAFLAQAGQLIGTLQEVNPKSGTLTLHVEYQHPVLEPKKNPAPKPQPKRRPQPRNNNRNNNRNRNNQHHGASLQQLLNQRQQVMKIQNPAERQRRWQELMTQIQRAQAQEMQKDLHEMQMKLRQIQANTPNVKIEKGIKEVELPIATTVNVRRWDLPLTYDSKGNVKEYSKEEIEKLRGEDKSKPGFPATFTDLHPGQTVRLYLGNNAAASPRPQVSMVLLLVDSYDLGAAGKKKGK